MKAKTVSRYKSKSLEQLKQLAQRKFNAFIRRRDTINDTYFVCISCGQPKKLDKMHAGHYFSSGKHPEVTFNEDNVHGQCSYCNTYEHGNLIKYTENLPKRIGHERFEKLKMDVAKCQGRAYKREKYDYIEIIEKYK